MQGPTGMGGTPTTQAAPTASAPTNTFSGLGNLASILNTNSIPTAQPSPVDRFKSLMPAGGPPPQQYSYMSGNSFPAPGTPPGAAPPSSSGNPFGGPTADPNSWYRDNNRQALIGTPNPYGWAPDSRPRGQQLPGGGGGGENHTPSPTPGLPPPSPTPSPAPVPGSSPPPAAPPTTPTFGDQTGDPARWAQYLQSGYYQGLDPNAQSALRATLGL